MRILKPCWQRELQITADPAYPHQAAKTACGQRPGWSRREKSWNLEVRRTRLPQGAAQLDGADAGALSILIIDDQDILLLLSCTAGPSMASHYDIEFDSSAWLLVMLML